MLHAPRRMLATAVHNTGTGSQSGKPIYSIDAIKEMHFPYQAPGRPCVRIFIASVVSVVLGKCSTFCLKMKALL